MKKLWCLLLLTLLVAFGACNRKEEKVEGSLSLKSGETKSFEGYVFHNKSNTEAVINLVKTQEGLNTTLASSESIGLNITKEQAAKSKVDENYVKLVSEDTVQNLFPNRAVSVTVKDREIKFPNTLPAEKGFDESIFLNLIDKGNEFTVVSGFENGRFLEGKVALYLDKQLVYVNNNLSVSDNATTARLEATFEKVRSFNEAQVVYANVENGQTRYYASKIAKGQTNVLRSVAQGTFTYPKSLPTNTSGINYKPVASVKTWEKYTEDTPVYVGGVVYWTTQELVDTWAVYVDKVLAYEGSVTRSGSSMSMQSAELNMTAGTHNIQVVFGAMVNGAVAYGISDAKSLTVGAGSLSRGDLKVNIAKPAFAESAFVPQVTVGTVTKDGAWGQSLVFDRLEAGKSYDVIVKDVILGAKTYRATVNPAKATIVKDGVVTVDVSYTEEATKTGILEVNIAKPAFAESLFTPVVTVNGISKTGTWGGKILFDTFLGGERVKVEANAFANESNKYMPTVTPAEHVIAAEGTVTTSITYKKELKGSEINPDGTIVVEPPFAPAFNGTQRVIGYVPTWKPEANMDQIAWENLTHVNIAFLEFDRKADGSFSQKALDNLDKWIPQVKALAKKDGATVSIAVGGAEDYGFLWMAEKYKDNPELIETAANNIVAFVDKYGLDGVDLDLECWWKDPATPGTAERGGRTRGTDKWGGSVETGADPAAYGMTLLAKKLRAKRPNMIISAAVFATPWYGNNYDATAVNYLDWIGLMSYDFTGSWDKSPKGPHSALYDVASGYPGQSDANPIYSVETAMRYWTGTWSTWQGSGQNVSRDKVIVGMPFYGYDLSVRKADIGQGLNGYKYIGYSDIVAQYAKAPTSYDPKDTYNMIGFIGDGGALIYYDTPKAVKEKVRYAKREGVQGTMIWELTQDLPGTDMNSLLKAVGEAYTE